MEINEFIVARPYLYHLTDTNNLESILSSGKLYSTEEIFNMSLDKSLIELLGKRRPEHTIVKIKGKEYRIRDQRPISEKVLGRSLTNNWKTSDFIKHLNRRVFFWPTTERLVKHYTRYKNEEPTILRFKSEDLLKLNPNAEFCRLNSGATRCSSHWSGNAPERGPKTFLNATDYNLSIGSVAEVTIPRICKLPSSISISQAPQGPWKNIKL